jgi:hypothetical protein
MTLRGCCWGRKDGEEEGSREVIEVEEMWARLEQIHFRITFVKPLLSDLKVSIEN